MTQPRKLYSAEFVSLIFILFFGFCNMSVFYSFYSYLERLGISAEWRGIVVGLEPMTAFFLRPAVAVFIHAGNAMGFLRFSMILLALILCAYTVTDSLPGLILLRICHGAAFVTLVSAGVALLVHFIPQKKSAQGFGVMSLASLIPYAVAPMLTEIALRHFRSEAVIYALVSILAIPGIVLIIAVGPRIRSMLVKMDPGYLQRPAIGQLWQNIRQVPVILILSMNLLIFFTYATVFYFIKSFLVHSGHWTGCRDFLCGIDGRHDRYPDGVRAGDGFGQQSPEARGNGAFSGGCLCAVALGRFALQVVPGGRLLRHGDGRHSSPAQFNHVRVLFQAVSGNKQQSHAVHDGCRIFFMSGDHGDNPGIRRIIHAAVSDLFDNDTGPDGASGRPEPMAIRPCSA